MCSRSTPSLPGSAVLSFLLYSPTPPLLSAKNDENIPLRGSFQHATAVPPNPEERPGYQPQARTTTQPEQQTRGGGRQLPKNKRGAVQSKAADCKPSTRVVVHSSRRVKKRMQAGLQQQHHYHHRTATRKGQALPSARLLRRGTSLEDSLREGSVLRDVLDGVAVLLQPALLASPHVLLRAKEVAEPETRRNIQVSQTVSDGVVPEVAGAKVSSWIRNTTTAQNIN